MVRIKTSKPIHILGIKEGQEIILDYDINDLSELFLDLKSNRTKLILNEETMETYLLLNWTIEIKDLIEE